MYRLLLHTNSTIRPRASQPWGRRGINTSGRAIPQPCRKVIHPATPSTVWNMIVKWAVKRLCKSLGNSVSHAGSVMFGQSLSHQGVSHKQYVQDFETLRFFLPLFVCEWTAFHLLAADWSKWKHVFCLVNFYLLFFFTEGQWKGTVMS